MKPLALAILLICAHITATLTRAADTPATILADFHTKAAPALAKVNATLEKASVPLIAALVKAGDTAGAEILKQQLQAKIDGEPVVKPQPTAAALFASYDLARIKALEPAQKSAIARIDALLASSDGQKLDVVTELGKVRAEIQTASVLPPSTLPTVPEFWDYLTSADGRKMGTFSLHPDGTFDLLIPTSKKRQQTGTWQPTRRPGVLSLDCEETKWEVQITGDTATLKYSDGTLRWLRRAQQ